MTIKALYPTVRPTLNLDFAKTKALDPRITFTRASTATFVGADGLIQTAASGAARFDHNPATGESLGLLVEEARTNLLTYSEQFNDASWTKYGTSITANSITAPDGTQTADLIVESSGAANRGFYNIISVSAIPYTYSIYVKQKERKFITLTSALSSGDLRVATFDVNAGTVTNSIASTATITFVGNGWYRCAITYTATATGSWYVGAQMSDSGAAGYQYSYTGDGTSGIYIWGAQLEAGSFPTSYIPTTGSTVTRAADVASMTGTNFSSWYNQSQGTLYAAVRASSTSNSCAWTISDGSYNNRITSFTGADYSFYVVTGGAIQAQQSAGSYAIGSLVAATGAYSANNFNYARSGSVLTSDTSGAVPIVNRLAIMAGDSGGQVQTGTIARLAYYPVRLPDAQLQALTAT